MSVETKHLRGSLQCREFSIIGLNSLVEIARSLKYFTAGNFSL